MRINKFKCNLCGHETDPDDPMVAIVKHCETKKYVMTTHSDGDFHVCRMCKNALIETFVPDYYPAS